MPHPPHEQCSRPRQHRAKRPDRAVRQMHTEKDNHHPFPCEPAADECNGKSRPHEQCSRPRQHRAKRPDRAVRQMHTEKDNHHPFPCEPAADECNGKSRIRTEDRYGKYL